ncbi:hypothetical protein [Streptomyces sp. NPDC051665]|uniref:hypothetical protein n=1 Tax=Streptomyces sp. NPDC051665 TaxID=3154647 RepID=UPI00341DBF3B
MSRASASCRSPLGRGFPSGGIRTVDDLGATDANLKIVDRLPEDAVSPRGVAAGARDTPAGLKHDRL